MMKVTGNGVPRAVGQRRRALLPGLQVVIDLSVIHLSAGSTGNLMTRTWSLLGFASSRSIVI